MNLTCNNAVYDLSCKNILTSSLQAKRSDYFYGKGLTYKEKFETDGTSKKEYYFYDRLGNVVMLLDEDTNVLERNKLDPFGNTILRTSKTDNKRLFIGKERDYETGLDYFEARYMNNQLNYGAGLLLLC